MTMSMGHPVARDVSSLRAAPPFHGDGEMAVLCRQHDWTRTALGAVEEWPATLRAFAALVVASPFPMVLLWGDDLLQLYSDGYRTVLGARHPVSLGQPVHECWPDARSMTAPICERVRGGEHVVVEQAPYQVLREHGPVDAWFTTGYSPVRDEEGTVRGVLVSLFDTSEQVLSQRRAEMANRAKGDFLNVMTHELRTPLNAIGGYAELLELGVRGPITVAQREDLGRIQRSQQHLLEVINRVLNYAKVDAGLLHYAVEDVEMDDLLARCDTLIAPEVREKGLELRHATCSTGLAARADAAKVQQIVLDLLSNAVKFTPAGGRVTLSCAAEEGKRLQVQVADTGCGIAASDLECVFLPFVQVDAATTRAHEGAGLGLAISREMARGMGGDLTVSSEQGKGSRFVLTLACGRGDRQVASPGKRDGDQATM